MERDVVHVPLQQDAEQTGIDLDQLTDAIWEEMKGRINKVEIRQILEQILPSYQDARIWGFVPILMRRELAEILVATTSLNRNALPL